MRARRAGWRHRRTAEREAVRRQNKNNGWGKKTAAEEEAKADERMWEGGKYAAEGGRDEIMVARRVTCTVHII